MEHIIFHILELEERSVITRMIGNESTKSGCVVNCTIFAPSNNSTASNDQTVVLKTDEWLLVTCLLCILVIGVVGNLPRIHSFIRNSMKEKYQINALSLILLVT